MKLRIFLISCILLLLPLCMRAAAVSPATLDASGNRGEVVKAKVTVINAQVTEQTYYLDTLSFTAKDNSGEPLFSATKTDDQLAKWIQFTSNRFSVPANSKVDLPFTINVPSDAVSGSYQSAITISGAPSEVVATNGAVIEAKTAVLLFFTVNGESVKKVSLLDFIQMSKGVQSDLHQTYQFRIQNQGNVYATPRGVIEYKDLFGRTIRTVDANKSKSRILPATTRLFVVQDEKVNGWFNQMQEQAKTFAIGPMQAKLTLELGEGFSPLLATTSFWYVPYQLLSSVVIVFLLLWVGYRKLEKHKTK